MKQRIQTILSSVLHFLTPVRMIVIAVMGAFFWFVILGDKGIYQMRRLLDMKNRLATERRSLNDDIDRLTEEKRLLSDPANLEASVRSELGYIKPGEVVFEDKK
ncbi:MAG: septum formation initiator family protein [Pseudomonadota bacterium]